MNQRFKVVGLGEALWDLFPDGPRFGGAPANFACHAAMLGADCFMLSQVGADDLGERALAALQACGVQTQYVRTGNFPTGTVQVSLDERGKPQFEIREGVAWDHLVWSDDLESLAKQADCVCFGSLGQRCDDSAQTIRRFLSATRPDCLRIFDVNLRQTFYTPHVVLHSLHLASVVKLNDEELPVVASIASLIGTDGDLLAALAKRFHLRLVALTRGERGAVLHSGEANCECIGPTVRVVDTVGAGDAFTAALALGWLRGRDLATICQHACQIAAYVCSQPGATPLLPDELRA